MSPDQAAVLTRVQERWPRLTGATPGATTDLPPGDDRASHEAIDRAAELYLARACAEGDTAAIAAFEAEFFAEVRICHARTQPRGLGLDELEQRIRDKLFVGRAIASFSGKGDLRRWLRVLTTRVIFDHARGRHFEVPLEDELLAAPQSSADAALAKLELRAEIGAALRQAMAIMTDRQKLLLLTEIRGTPLSGLATTYGVTMRSVRRWAADAHDAFLAAFRRALGARLRIASGELSSVLAFARSQLASGLVALALDGDGR
jgi:RNA polymerase sigma-70 factor (ECF subfamily)